MRIFLYLIFLFCVAFRGARGMCYLTGDDCPICFITDPDVGSPVASYCPEDIDLHFTTEPADPMVSFETYQVVALLTVNTTAVHVVDQSVNDQIYQLPHTNVHSCISKNGVCTPMIQNTPSLSTHTQAIAMNLTAPTAENPDISKTVIRTDVTLTSEQYQIIMHVRLFRLDSDGKTRKYDIAMGISRNVVAPEEEIGRSSATSIISAAGIVLVILFGCGFIQFKVYTGTFTWDSLLTSLSGEYVVNFVRIVIKIAGMSVWTVFFGSTMLTEGDLVNVVPLAYCAVTIGWIFSLYCVYAYSRNVYFVFSDENSEVLSERQKKNNELQRNLHDKLLDFYGIFFESIPLTSCLVWAALLINEADIVTLVALSLSMGDLGFKLMSVKGYKDVKSEIEIIEEAATLSKLLENAVGTEKAEKMTMQARRQSKISTGAVKTGVVVPVRNES